MLGTPEGGAPVRLDTTTYLPEHTPAPAVLLAHGFGESKDSVAGEAKTLAQHGYVVLTWSARGFGNSGGKIHLDAPGYEVHDASLLLSWLLKTGDVLRGQVAVAGSSYGGALALLLGGTDRRIRAVAADITWNDLASALFPNAGGGRPGVFKKLWAGYLFQAGFTAGGTATCGRFAADVCAAYQHAARTGRPSPRLLRLLRDSSPAHVLAHFTAPTLLTQGEQDSLFGLDQADANARGIAATGTPVQVVWRSGGHDDSSVGGDQASSALLGWLGSVFGSGVHGVQEFTLARGGATVSAETGRLSRVLMRADGYPGIDARVRSSATEHLTGPPQTISAPAGGNPAAISSVPLLGGLLAQAGALGAAATSGLSLVPGQVAGFVSAPLGSSVLVGGSSTVRLRVTSRTTTDAVLFAALRDVGGTAATAAGTAALSAAAAGSATGAAGSGSRTAAGESGAPDLSALSGTLPAGLVAPLRITGLRPGVPRTVAVHLPWVVTNVPAGHRLALTVSTTDLAYSMPTDPRSYRIELAGGLTGTLRVPGVEASVVRAGHPLLFLIVAAAVCLLALLLVTTVLRRRRKIVRPAPELADVPVAITSVSKSYRGGYRAVDDVSFTVQKGQVVGLLGPNGAGKTTTLRMLVGLISPTSGTMHVFGQPVLPGAPVLARLGAFIEGPGFLPHLSGRDNLRLYWAATGRPAEEAQLATALDIAGLGASLDRRVSTYSHGMKQRLGIAQAMLGMPELLVLDEPTNGLDPPQIAEMREVMQRYADTGRTVVVSSHLLAEVEQTCTHVVVMHRGRLVAAGSVLEIAGAGGTQLAVDDPGRASEVLSAAGIAVRSVPARRALEDVFLDLIGSD